MHFLKDRGFVHSTASDITPQQVYQGRRKLVQGMAAGAALGSLPLQPAHAQTARPGKLAALAGGKSAAVFHRLMGEPR